MFKSIDPEIWKAVNGNPVMLLNRVSYERLEEIVANKSMMYTINAQYEKFRKYIDEKPKGNLPSVAYFSMEYGLANVLKIYSGGLGILAGDYLKEASDSNIDMVACGFPLSSRPFYPDSLDGWSAELANYEPQNFNQLPIEQVVDENGHPIILEVPYPGRIVYANIWRVNVGRVSSYLMDTDLELNSEFDRSITYQLYGGDWENRMKQEYPLGIGGILMLKRLGIKKDVYHCNEGHAALINVQRLVDYIQDEKLSFCRGIGGCTSFFSLYRAYACSCRRRPFR